MAFQWYFPDPRPAVDALDDNDGRRLGTYVESLRELAQVITTLEEHFQRLLQTPAHTVSLKRACYRAES